jgi:hypothetical protein
MAKKKTGGPRKGRNPARRPAAGEPRYLTKEAFKRLSRRPTIPVDPATAEAKTQATEAFYQWLRDSPINKTMIALAERTRTAGPQHSSGQALRRRPGRPPELTDAEYWSNRPRRPLSDGQMAIYLKEKLSRPVSPDQVRRTRVRLNIPATQPTPRNAE